MSVDPTIRRERRRRPRRARWAVPALLLVAVAGIVTALALRGGESASTTTEAARPPHVKQVPTTTTAPAAAALDRLIRTGLPIYCGGNRRKYVALTFDDGPGPYTELALRILRLARVRATFFLVGRNLSSWPDMPKRELALGTVGDHTWTHAYLPSLGADALASEIGDTQKAAESATGRPVRLFRPPYGAHNAAVDVEARTPGMLQVLWSIDSLDSQGADYDGIERTVLRKIRPGSIVLLHENRGQTIRALKFFILPELRRRGLVPVSVDELLARDPPSIAQLRAGGRGC